MVYVDLLVIQDLIYNYVILLGVSLLLTRITNFKRILLSSVDQPIKVWNISSNNNIQLIRILSQHKGKVKSNYNYI